MQWNFTDNADEPQKHCVEWGKPRRSLTGTIASNTKPHVAQREVSGGQSKPTEAQTQGAGEGAGALPSTTVSMWGGP